MEPTICQRCGYIARTSDEVDAHEVEHTVYDEVRTFENFETVLERHMIERTRGAATAAAIRAGAAYSFTAGGRP